MKNEYNANIYIGINNLSKLKLKRKKKYVDMRDVLKIKMKFISNSKLFTASIICICKFLNHILLIN